MKELALNDTIILTAIHKESSWYETRQYLIGQAFKITQIHGTGGVDPIPGYTMGLTLEPVIPVPYKQGWLDASHYLYFLAIKGKVVPPFKVLHTADEVIVAVKDFIPLRKSYQSALKKAKKKGILFSFEVWKDTLRLSNMSCNIK